MDATEAKRKLHQDQLAVALAEWKKLEDDLKIQMELTTAAKSAECRARKLTCR